MCMGVCVRILTKSLGRSAAAAWNGGGCSRSPGPLGPTCVQHAVGNRVNYGARDLRYSSCMFSNGSGRPGAGTDLCNCCPCVDDIGFVHALLSLLQTALCIDRRRIFATGHSYGGMFTYQLGLDPILSQTFGAWARAATPVPKMIDRLGFLPLCVLYYNMIII